MRAILVDDERANLEILQVLLEKYCPEIKIVATANQVGEAVEVLNLHRPDLLFLDI
jgi:two-component system LytT family response regulator